MSSGGGSSSSSKPLSAAQRSAIFKSGMSNVNNYKDSSVFGDVGYNAPSYASSGGYQRLSDGDYDAYQQAMYDSSTAGLQQYEDEQRQRTDQSMSDRGIWSSGAAEQAQADVTDQFASLYSQAGANSAASRYALEAQDNANASQYNQNESSMLNSFNMNNAQQDYASQWAPLEYLMGMYNQTGGAVSNSESSSSPFNFGLSF